jgi:predicted Zn finger-like uncharacterized protein
MRIACPSCAAEYEVPDALLAGGPRQLRCTRCGHAFTGALPGAPPTAAPPSEPAAEAGPGAQPPVAIPPAEAGPPPVEAAPDSAPGSAPDSAPDSAPAEPAPLPPLRDRPKPTRGPTQPSPIEPPPPAAPRPLPLAAAWIGSFAVLGAGAFAALRFQAEITAAWPPAARLFAALGLG